MSAVESHRSHDVPMTSEAESPRLSRERTREWFNHSILAPIRQAAEAHHSNSVLSPRTSRRASEELTFQRLSEDSTMSEEVAFQRDSVQSDPSQGETIQVNLIQVESIQSRDTIEGSTGDPAPNDYMEDDSTRSEPAQRDRIPRDSRRTASEELVFQKNRNRSVADDLICPITLELPYEPVTAEDGRLYERYDIEKYFHGHSIEEIKSPVSNAPMGKKLLPAPQIKSHIELLLDVGLITGDLALRWKEKQKQKEDMEILLKKAEEGDATSMDLVAFNYRHGGQGFKKDNQKAYHWQEQAHKAGSSLGTARVGEYLVKGIGVKRNVPKGFVYLTLAAEKGSDIAAFLLGTIFAEGRYGVTIDKWEAIHWLEKVMSDDYNLHHGHGDHENRKCRAQVKLDELTGVSTQDE